MKKNEKSISSRNCSLKRKKLESGITLTSLVVTITVIIILAGTTIYAGGSAIQHAKVTKFNSELKIIHTKVNEIVEENKSQDNLDEFGKSISTVSTDIQTKINTVMQGASTNGFRYFDKYDLKDIGVNDIDRQVIINFSTREVVDINGVEENGSTIYRLKNWNNVVYQDRNTEAPSFNLSKKIYGLSANICVTDIEYKGNVGKKQISYCLFNNQTEGNWKDISGEEFKVEQSGTYKVKLVDSANNITEKTVEVVLANKPKLDSGMIPVVYDATLGKWKKVSEDSGDWYDYARDKKQWANVMLQDGLVVNADGTIDTANMGSMFVWIPRYMYQISEKYHPSASTELPIEGNVNIKFLKGTTNIATDGTNVKISNSSGQGNWNVHPAFCNGAKTNFANGEWNKEITGFWVAKFEASSSATTVANPQLGSSYGGGNTIGTQTVRSVPNVTSWRYIDVINVYTVCKNMSTAENPYGLTTESNPHMMKNSEWGAIAYLIQSDYGNKQTKTDSSSGVWNNPYYEGDLATDLTTSYGTTMTGVVGTSRDEEITWSSKATSTIDKSNSQTISITYQNYSSGTASGSTYTRTYYRYQTTQGQKGSSTRNIYGIYDLAGGAWEYVAGYLASGTNSYVTFFKNLPAEEKQEYLGEGGESDVERKSNFQANSAKYGDAIWETARDDAGAPWRANAVNPWYLSWNNDYSTFPYVTSTFFLRGGRFDDSHSVGAFAFINFTGSGYLSCGFRPVVI